MVDQLNLEGVSYLLPILNYLLVVIIGFVIINKSKIVEQPWLQIFISLIVATIFITALGPSNFVLSITPLTAILFVCLFFALLLVGFVGGDLVKNWTRPIGIGFFILLILVFIISAIFVFRPYYQGNPTLSVFWNWVTSSSVAGAIMLMVVAAAVAFVLFKVKAK